LIPLAVAAPALMLITSATAVLLGVVIWDLMIERRRLAAEAQTAATAGAPITAELEV
jgi:hypothetical protein